jgi:hypothetical protein
MFVEQQFRLGQFVNPLLVYLKGTVSIGCCSRTQYTNIHESPAAAISSFFVGKINSGENLTRS